MITKRISSKKKHSGQKSGQILPPPDHEQGYTDLYLDLCLIMLGINSDNFWKAFGVNTCAYDKKKKCSVYYPCDVERALHIMTHPAGKHHEWD